MTKTNKEQQMKNKKDGSVSRLKTENEKNMIKLHVRDWLICSSSLGIQMEKHECLSECIFSKVKKSWY